MLSAVVAVVAMATVKLNKQVSEKVRELNALGTFLTDVRLGAVARKLSELPMEKALEVLQSVVDAAEGGDESRQTMLGQSGPFSTPHMQHHEKHSI